MEWPVCGVYAQVSGLDPKDPKLPTFRMTPAGIKISFLLQAVFNSPGSNGPAYRNIEVEIQGEDLADCMEQARRSAKQWEGYLIGSGNSNVRVDANILLR